MVDGSFVGIGGGGSLLFYICIDVDADVEWSFPIDSCSLNKLCIIFDHLTSEWSLLLDETITSFYTSLIIYSISCIDSRFFAMFNSDVSFSLDASFPNDLGSLPEPFRSSCMERTSRWWRSRLLLLHRVDLSGDVGVVFFYQVLEGGLLRVGVELLRRGSQVI